MYIDTKLMNAWNLQTTPNFNKIDLLHPSFYEYNILSRSEIDAITYKIIHASKIRPSSLLCITGDRGSGKSSILKLCHENISNAVFIDIKDYCSQESPRTITDSEYFNFCLDLSIKSDLASDDNVFEQAYRNTISRPEVRNSQFIDRVINFNSAFSGLIYNFSTFELSDEKKYIFIDNIDKFEKYDYRHFLSFIGSISYSCPNLSFIIPVDPPTRDLFLYQSFRGAHVDITDIYESSQIKSSEIIQRRIDLSRIPETNDDIFSQAALRVIDGNDNHALNLRIAEKSIERAINYIDLKKPVIKDRDVLRIIDLENLFDSDNERFYSIIDSSKISYTMEGDKYITQDAESALTYQDREKAISAPQQPQIDVLKKQILENLEGEQFSENEINKLITAIHSSPEYIDFVRRYHVHRVSSMLLNLKHREREAK